MGFFKPILDSSHFLFIFKYPNLKNELPVSRYFEKSLEISTNTLNNYHNSKISIDEVLSISSFFDDLNKNLTFCSLMSEIANKEGIFESFLDYGGTFSLAAQSKTEFLLNFSSKYPFKLLMSIRNIYTKDKARAAFCINFAIFGRCKQIKKMKILKNTKTYCHGSKNI